MNSRNFLKSINTSPDLGGDGIRCDVDIDIRGAFLFSSGADLTTTITTNPGWAMIETNLLALTWDNVTPVAAGVMVNVPGDYDQVADDLKIRMRVHMAGSTDAPSFTANIYRKRAGAALVDLGTKTLTLPGTTTAATLSSTPQIVEWNLAGLGLQPNDTLCIKMTPGTHATDDMYVTSIVSRYKSLIALKDLTAR